MQRNSEKKHAADMRLAQTEYEQGQSRIAALDKIMQRLYEDHVMEKISEERFSRMSADYEAEQKALTERVTILKAMLNITIEQMLNIDRFLTRVKAIRISLSWTAR